MLHHIGGCLLNQLISTQNDNAISQTRRPLMSVVPGRIKEAVPNAGANVQEGSSLRMAFTSRKSRTIIQSDPRKL
jgi:hypothetical protein